VGSCLFPGADGVGVPVVVAGALVATLFGVLGVAGVRVLGVEPLLLTGICFSRTQTEIP
jgi:hypothetical protein